MSWKFLRSRLGSRRALEGFTAEIAEIAERAETFFLTDRPAVRAASSRP
jgi:hypothetical protein